MSFSGSQEAERGNGTYSLFTIVLSPVRTFRYTDADDEVWFEGNKYEPHPISYSSIVTDGTLEKANLNVTMAPSNAAAKSFRRTPPSRVATVRIHESHFTDAGRNTRLVWQGRILNYKDDSRKSTLACQTGSTSLTRPGLRLHYQRSCPHQIYGGACALAPNYESVTFIDATPGIFRVVTPSGFGGAATLNRYEGGLLSWTDAEGEDHFATVINASLASNIITLRVASTIDPNGPSQVTLLKGCAHTETSCRDWHNNLQNFGGYPFIPDDSPLNKFSTYY